MIAIQPISSYLKDFEILRIEAQTEGYDFIATLVDEWLSGANRFDKPGEILLGCFEEKDRDGHPDSASRIQLIAVGGLTIDPWVNSPEVGRIRRVYVRAPWRNQGLGSALVRALLAESAKAFRIVRLRAENSDASRLYERLGFSPIDDQNATHLLSFEPQPGKA